MDVLEGVIQVAPPGVLGVDTDSRVSAATARQLRQLNYQFCARYLSLGMPQQSVDLSAQEALDILSAGLALVPVQHVLKPGWSPSSALGAAHGEAAFQNAQQIGIPMGVNVWCDLEGIALGTSTQAIIDYCNAWYAELDCRGKGYVPGVYIGYHEYLNPAELHESLLFQHYWSAPLSTPVAGRGSQLIQLLPLNRKLAGVDIDVDVDVTQQDAQGDSLKWLAPAAPPTT